MAGRQPEERVLVPALVQGWRDVAFLHWRVDADIVGAALPAGLRPHVIEGSAWVSLTPFLVVLGPVRFPETNLRTYVVGPHDKDGIFFLAIEADAILTTLGARAAYGAPYVKADMSVDKGDGEYRYRSPRTRIAVRPGDPLDDGERSPLDDALTGQWRGYTHHLGMVLRTNVTHEPWPLQRATVTDLHETLTERAGLPELGEPDLVHWSPGVNVRLSRPYRG